MQGSDLSFPCSVYNGPEKLPETRTLSSSSARPLTICTSEPWQVYRQFSSQGTKQTEAMKSPSTMVGTRQQAPQTSVLSVFFPSKMVINIKSITQTLSRMLTKCNRTILRNNGPIITSHCLHRCQVNSDFSVLCAHTQMSEMHIAQLGSCQILAGTFLSKASAGSSSFHLFK